MFGLGVLRSYWRPHIHAVENHRKRASNKARLRSVGKGGAKSAAS